MVLPSSKAFGGLVQRCRGGVRRKRGKRQREEKEQTVGEGMELWNQGNKDLPS